MIWKFFMRGGDIFSLPTWQFVTRSYDKVSYKKIEKINFVLRACRIYFLGRKIFKWLKYRENQNWMRKASIKTSENKNKIILNRNWRDDKIVLHILIKKERLISAVLIKFILSAYYFFSSLNPAILFTIKARAPSPVTLQAVPKLSWAK